MLEQNSCLYFPYKVNLKTSDNRLRCLKWWSYWQFLGRIYISGDLFPTSYHTTCTMFFSNRKFTEAILTWGDEQTFLSPVLKVLSRESQQWWTRGDSKLLLWDCTKRTDNKLDWIFSFSRHHCMAALFAALNQAWLLKIYSLKDKGHFFSIQNQLPY